MAGLAATTGLPARAGAVADALAARGPATASWQVDGLQVVVRAAMPAVHQVHGRAVAIDGHAAPTALVGDYLRDGPAAMLAGPDPYAVILADPVRDALLLGRHGDGPPLCWAWHGSTVLAASEPAALVAAGVPAEPDPAVVARFLSTGACDQGSATFFAGIRRVLPGQVVEVTRDPGAATFTIRTHRAAAAPPPAPARGRIGVRLAGADASVVEQLLRIPGSPRPLPVYSAAFPELATTAGASSPAAVALAPLARSAAIRHRALPFFADEIDVDAYLADLGEPTPDLDDWLLWGVARRVAGEVDVLVDPATAPHRSRLADRTAARFGVLVRTAPAGGTEPVAVAGGGSAALTTQLLRRMRVELVTTLLHPRHPDRATGLAEVMALLSGAPVDAAAVWRRYMLERWLRNVAGPPAGLTPVPARAPGPIIVDGVEWTRQPVRTEPLAAGDKLPEKVAWYVGEAAPTAPRLWYVLVAARPVAVVQGRVRPLWDVRPGATARSLARLAGRRSRLAAGPAGPWTVQAVIDEYGWGAAVAAVLAGRLRWYGRWASPAPGSVRGPRADAVPPGHTGVTLAPAVPDRAAADVVAALRTAVPEDAYATFGGCAVVGSGPNGDPTILGWAGRPGAAPLEPGLLAALAAGDPFGDDHTPILLATRAARPAPAGRS